MDYPIFDGELAVETRQDGEGRTIRASFPYNRVATISSTGRTRKEVFRSGSLSWQVREFEKLQQQLSDTISGTISRFQREAVEDALEKRNTFLLVGHDYNRAIADMRSGTLAVTHTDDAVLLRADIPAEGQAPSWVEDAVKGINGGQVRGVSPGFQVPARRGGERLIPEEGDGGAMMREITDAVAFEYSLLARPAYSGTTVDARADDPALVPPRRRVWL